MEIVRSEVSKKNKYWLEKYRYYELKNFCLQYSSWKAALRALDDSYIYSDGMSRRPAVLDAFLRSKNHGDPTAQSAMARSYYIERIEMVEKSALEASADSILSRFILKGVTTGMSYETMNVKYDVPCSKRCYYETYRKFFWLLDKVRD